MILFAASFHRIQPQQQIATRHVNIHKGILNLQPKGSFIRKLSMLAMVLGSLAACTSEPATSPSGMAKCAAGENGNGGIYRPETARCESGKIVQNGFNYCKKGANGNGGVYRPESANCEDGITVENGFEYCKKGSSGGGGKYNPSTMKCTDGKIY